MEKIKIKVEKKVKKSEKKWDLQIQQYIWDVLQLTLQYIYLNCTSSAIHK
jgi:hypothetical protein